MIVFIVGGSKSKKSYYGEKISESLFNNIGNLYYLATMKPYDKEDLKRIDEHIKSRDGHGYKTLEVQRDIISIIDIINAEDTILLDSITSLATNEMFPSEKIVENIREKIVDEISKISTKVRNLVIVSDYVFSDGIIYDECTENFRRELGKINFDIAKISDVVIESSFGNLIVHKGKERIKNEALI